MQPSPPEQFLEWTFQQRWLGMHIAQMLCDPIMLLFYVISIGWLLGLMPPPPDMDRIILMLCFVLFIIMLVILRISSRLPSRTLRIDRQTVTLTDKYLWRTPKERRMNISGAKFRTVYHDGFARFFTWNGDLVDSAYHIEITWIGETFLFPCHDEGEQSQIIKQIKEFLSQ